MFCHRVIRSWAYLKGIGICLVIVGLLVLPGCEVMSIHPLYEDVSPKDPDIVLDKDLAGSWSLTDGKCTTTLTVTAKEEIYDFRSVKEGEGCSDAGEEARMQARLVKLDSYYFLDVSPRAEDVCDTCLALHWISLARFDKDTLSLTPIDSDGLNELLRAGTVHLKILPEDPKLLIPERPTTLTALSKDLKNFCRKFAGNKKIFKPESTETLTRK
ncbi:MAG: hypothetical protein WA424_02095 [Candidatus Sulfotelmatobacter sp.]